jgi:hypothetical protein
MVETTKFPERGEYMDTPREIMGNRSYYNSQLKEINQLTSENKRLHHLTTVLIDHIWKSGERKIPLKEIDRQMELYDLQSEVQ